MKKEIIKIKRDEYFRKRGSYCRIIKIKCAKCKKVLFQYQKDGPGCLKRCYSNRLIGKRLNFKKNLVCSCGNLIGTPLRHVFRSDGITPDGRMAFEMIRKRFERTYSLKLT